MIEIYPNLFIGTEQDYENGVNDQTGWMIVHACKEPYHRQLLGYTTRGAPKDHPEYLMAQRGNRLILNLVDTPNPAFIPKEIIDTALYFIHKGLSEGCKVLIHCNLGESRSPSIGLLYLRIHTDILPDEFALAEGKFREIYPPYNPSMGIRGFVVNNWNSYIFRKEM